MCLLLRNAFYLLQYLMVDSCNGGSRERFSSFHEGNVNDLIITDGHQCPSYVTCMFLECVQLLESANSTKQGRSLDSNPQPSHCEANALTSLSSCCLIMNRSSLKSMLKSPPFFLKSFISQIQNRYIYQINELVYLPVE